MKDIVYMHVWSKIDLFRGVYNVRGRETHTSSTIVRFQNFFCLHVKTDQFI